jgi:CubicO group peptidase (beta-lactamase class C family)
MSVVTGFLDSAVASGAAPGAVLGVLQGHQRFVHGTGQLGADQTGRPGGGTMYDLASVTKVVGLATAAMLAAEEGKLDLDAPVHRYVPAFSGSDKDRVTVRMLLAHASGLPAWRPLFREVPTRAQVFALVDTLPLESAPGARATYSDLGAILLTQVIEAIYQERLDSLLQRRVFGPLGMTSSVYRPAPGLRDRIAPTELDRWRGRVLQGEVHDENAAVMDGVSGHAGLFSSAEDLLTFADWMLSQEDGGTGGQADNRTGNPSGGPTVRPSVLRDFTRRQHLLPGSRQALLWDTPSPGSSAGRRLSSGSFGHVGFTGTSLWIDPERRVAIVLLSNRISPTRNNPRWNPLRAAVADLVMSTLSEDAR